MLLAFGRSEWERPCRSCAPSWTSPFAQRVVDDGAWVVPVSFDLGGGRHDDIERCAAPRLHAPVVRVGDDQQVKVAVLVDLAAGALAP